MATHMKKSPLRVTTSVPLYSPTAMCKKVEVLLMGSEVKSVPLKQHSPISSE